MSMKRLFDKPVLQVLESRSLRPKRFGCPAGNPPHHIPLRSSSATCLLGSFCSLPFRTAFCPKHSALAHTFAASFPPIRPSIAMSAAGSGDGQNDAQQSSSLPGPSPAAGRMSKAKGPPNLQLKVGMLGDSYVGKTSLMVKYVENKFDEDYIQTLGINFMEKIISVRGRIVTFTIFDLGGGENEFDQMLPLVCADAAVMLFMFDLTRRVTLHSVRNWYKQARGFNQTFIPFLVGTKFDLFASLSMDKQRDMISHARTFANAMRSPLIFTSSSHSINVQKLFKVVFSKRFNFKCNVPRMSNVGEPILEY